MLPDAVRAAIEAEVGAPVADAAPVSGGSIAHAVRLVAGGRALFVKWGDADVASTFPAEAEGLEALRAAESPLRVPEVVARRPPDGEVPGFLLMDWMDAGRRSRGFWERFGQGLADLHRHTAPRYGFATDNFIGRLPQRNGWMPTWPAFFRRCRLEPQVAMARERGRWRPEWDAGLSRLLGSLRDLLPERPEPSLLHGDLWSGNYLVTVDGSAALIDPAVYYGHREAELAYTELFGGFEPAFYEAYREAWPLEPGYEERREVYNLYHLLNHLNHFGGGYAHDVARVLKAYG